MDVPARPHSPTHSLTHLGEGGGGGDGERGKDDGSKNELQRDTM